MLEIPEASVLAKQINATLLGKRIVSTTAAHSSHKFAWFHGNPADYGPRLQSGVVGAAVSHGGLVEITVDDCVLLFGDGVALRYLGQGAKRPSKHQLLLEFEDGSALSASVQMYGGLWCFKRGEFQNQYYDVARQKPSPLQDEFDFDYYTRLFSEPGVDNPSAKSFLATEQRIPGLGNGVLQDILFDAQIHPKRRVNTLGKDERQRLFRSIKTVLEQMTAQGGRDTEKDLFGSLGGYKTKMSKNTVNTACQVCGGQVEKQAYMGGSIYFCSGCQRI